MAKITVVTTPKEYIAAIRAECKAAIARGEQIDFFDAMAISRPTGEQAVFWMHSTLQEKRAECAVLQAALVEIREKITTATSYPETVAWVQRLIDLCLATPTADGEGR